MCQKIIIISLLLVLTIQVPHQSKPLNQVLAQIEQKHDFGKGLSALIQVTMSAAEPQYQLREIQTLLDDLKSNMEAFDLGERSQCDNKNSYCTITQQEQETNLSEKQEKLANQISDSEELRDIITETQGNLANERRNNDQSVTDLESTKSQIEQENTEFIEKGGDMTNLIIACEEGIRVLKRMIHGQDSLSLVQLSGHRQAQNFIQLKNVKKSIQEATDLVQKDKKKEGEMAMFMPVVAVLTSIQNNAMLNYEDLMNVIQLLEDILSRLKRDQQLLETRHTTVLQDLNSLLQNLQDQVDSSDKLIQIYQSRLSDAQRGLEELNAVIQDTTAVVTNLSQQLSVLNDDCDASRDTCRQGLFKRTQELAALQELIDYFNEQVKTSVGALGN